MEIIYYQNFTTNEIVYEEDAENYALKELGITVEPKGKNGEYNVEQLECIKDTAEWFFSGNWVKRKKKEKETDVFAMIKESCDLEDRRLM